VSGTQAVLFLVVVPLAVTLIVGGLAYVGGPRRDTRYRPGRPYRFSPVWYVANHRDAAPTAGREALPAGGGREALPAATRGGPGATDRGEAGSAPAKGATGGASDRW
jgi:hypothetical protein